MTLQDILESWSSEKLLNSNGTLLCTPQELFSRFGSLAPNERERYLTFIIAAGLNSHAESVSIDRAASRLTVVMPGAYLDKQDIQKSLHSLFSAHPSRGSELLLGLCLAQSFEATGSVLEARHPDLPSYRWSTEAPENFVEIENDAIGLTVWVDFEASWMESILDWVEALHQVEEAPECLALATLCRYSATPIEIEGRPINVPFSLQDAPISLIRGEPIPYQEYNGQLVHLPSADWNGVVALKTGRLQFMVRGLLYPGPNNLRLHGIVNCDSLRLSPDRDTVIQDDLYHSILKDLLSQQQVLLKRVDLGAAEFEWCSEMSDLFLKEEVVNGLNQESKNRLVNLLAQIPQGDNFTDQASELAFLFKAAEEYNALGLSAEREIAAEKAYQRARLMFDETRSLDHIDICIQLCHWLDHRTSEAYGWELLAASRALRKFDERSEERLHQVHKSPVGRQARAMASLALGVLLRERKEVRKSKEFMNRFEEECAAIPSRLERDELVALLNETSKTILVFLSTKFRHLASYYDEISQALE